MTSEAVCIFAHPENEEQKQEYERRLEYLKSIDDKPGIRIHELILEADGKCFCRK
jgi:hypothetical protein